MPVKDKKEIYKCGVCGNVVEVLFAGGGELVCCGKPMVLQLENTVDASKEKHIPVIEKTADGYKVKVGAIPHPMEEKHYIVMIELNVDGNSYNQLLAPGAAPEATFCVKGNAVSAREYCTLHGLWKA
jgi:superoxide reductase